MLILVVGAKGGTGTTTFVKTLVSSARLIGLDAADGALAGWLERPRYALKDVVGWGEQRLAERARRLARQRPVLLWDVVCDVFPQPPMLLQMVARLGTVVIDGGIEPSPVLWKLADRALIISLDDPAALYHEDCLKRRWREVHGGSKATAVVGNVEDAARALARKWFGVQVKPKKAPPFLRGMKISFK